MSKSDYYEKLKDPRWQKKRLEILERDNWTCIVCKDNNKTLHVHHKTYEYGNDPWDYPNSNLITLCKDCHAGEHLSKERLDNLELPSKRINHLTNLQLYAIIIMILTDSNHQDLIKRIHNLFVNDNTDEYHELKLLNEYIEGRIKNAQ